MLGDLEIAKSMHDDSAHVTGGTGTFASLSPEQVLEYRSYTATDIWGIGCVNQRKAACMSSVNK